MPEPKECVSVCVSFPADRSFARAPARQTMRKMGKQRGSERSEPNSFEVPSPLRRSPHVSRLESNGASATRLLSSEVDDRGSEPGGQAAGQGDGPGRWGAGRPAEAGRGIGDGKDGGGEGAAGGVGGSGQALSPDWGAAVSGSRGRVRWAVAEWSVGSMSHAAAAASWNVRRGMRVGGEEEGVQAFAGRGSRHGRRVVMGQIGLAASSGRSRRCARGLGWASSLGSAASSAQSSVSMADRAVGGRTR